MRWHDGSDLGSIESTGSTDGKWNFQLMSADTAKLPTDSSVAAGSSALVLDTGDILIFHAQSKTWVQQ